jgi:hypothetical protein
MQLYEMDSAKIVKIVVPVLAVVAIIVYLFLREMVLKVNQLVQESKMAREIEKMRSPATPTAAKQVIVRQTDLYGRLSEQGKKLHEAAEQLLQQGEIIEAASIFESINFQRRAIDILEQSGRIKEAAAILLKMNIPQRAAVVYERNGYFADAAHLFTQIGKHDLAGKCYEKMAETNFHFWHQAAEAYYQSGMLENAIQAYSKVLATQQVVKLALSSNKYALLVNYMSHPHNAYQVLSGMNPVEFERILAATGGTPAFAQQLATWVQCRPEPAFLNAVLQKISSEIDIALFFWRSLSEGGIRQILTLLAQNPAMGTAGQLRLHAEVMMQLQQAAYGGYLLQLAALREETRIAA